MKHHQFSPVLIIGAGPTGMTAALELAHYGIRSIILTADHKLCDGSRAIAFHQSALSVWEKLGAGKAILEKGVAWTARHTFVGKKKLYTQNFPTAKKGELPRFLNIQQSYVEQYLLDEIMQNPLIEIRWNHRVKGIQQFASGARVCADTPDGEIWESGSWVIACDGARSAMRRLLGVDFPGDTFADRFLIADIKADLDWPQEPRFFFDHPSHSGPTLLIHPQPDGIWRIDWQLPADADIALEKSPERMNERIQALVGNTPYELVWLSDYRFHQRILDKFRHGRVFFAGDSAHLVAPFGARGLNSAVHDVENLCWKIALVLRGQGSENLLDSYQIERHAAQMLNQVETRATMGFMCPQNAWQRLRRNAILLLSPFSKKALGKVNSGRMCQPFTYADTPLHTPDESPVASWSKSPALGSKIMDLPCNVLSKTEAYNTRLRHLMGNGFTLLHFAADVAQARLLEQNIEMELGSFPVSVVHVYGKLPSYPEGLEGLALLDEAGEISAALGGKQGVCFLIRPDGHLAARRHSPKHDWSNMIARACGLDTILVQEVQASGSALELAA